MRPGEGRLRLQESCNRLKRRLQDVPFGAQSDLFESRVTHDFALCLQDRQSPLAILPHFSASNSIGGKPPPLSLSLQLLKRSPKNTTQTNGTAQLELAAKSHSPPDHVNIPPERKSARPKGSRWASFGWRRIEREGRRKQWAAP